MSLGLDRIEIESVGSDPKRLASALLEQLPDVTRAIPIEQIALELDIVEVRRAPLKSIEGCLQCDPLKSEGQIIINTGSSPRRQRYTIGHELGHFLNERHRPTTESGFACTADDFSQPKRSGHHLIQEQEANTFAIEVLTPRTALNSYLRRSAELDQALAIADQFDISREAAIRRYVDLHGECLAAVFSKEGRVRYVEKASDFPATTMWVGDAIGHLQPRQKSSLSLTTLDEADAGDWIARPDGYALFTQSLFQDQGYAVTLLVAEPIEPDEDDDEPRFRR